MKKLTNVEFTNLDKVIYPQLGASKKDVLKYYIRIAPRMLPFLEDRVIVRNRFPDGIEKQGFYEKDIPMGTPEWVKIKKVYSASAEREVRYVVGNDLDTLLWLANQAALEINITLSKASNYENPDLVFIDLDPEPPAGFADSIPIARMVKEHLDKLGLRSFIKTSGKKGLHILLPIETSPPFRKTREFVHRLGKRLAMDSDMVVSEFFQGRDPGKIFIDFMQNNKGKTMIAPYSLRANGWAGVSTPLEWKEVKPGLRAEEFNINSVTERDIEPWEELFDVRQKLDV